MQKVTGFFVSQFEKVVKDLESRHFFPWILATGCCAHEIQNAGLATYDWQRLGVDDIAEDPTQANLLFIAGWINESRVAQIRQVYELMRRPICVVAVGACSISGSPYLVETDTGKYLKAESVIPVDVFVPGCPPKPEAILTAVLEVKRKLTPGPSAEEVLYAALRN